MSGKKINVASDIINTTTDTVANKADTAPIDPFDRIKELESELENQKQLNKDLDDTVNAYEKEISIREKQEIDLRDELKDCKTQIKEFKVIAEKQIKDIEERAQVNIERYKKIIEDLIVQMAQNDIKIAVTKDIDNIIDAFNQKHIYNASIEIKRYK